MRKVLGIELLAGIVYAAIPAAGKELDGLLGIPPSDCENCRHKQHPDGGHCYMFRNKPEGNCAQYQPLKKKSCD